MRAALNDERGLDGVRVERAAQEQPSARTPMALSSWRWRLLSRTADET